MTKPKVAIIHDYLIQYGGAEKTLDALLEIYPEADIFTGIYIPSKFEKSITSKKVTAPTGAILGKIYKYFTFLMPLVFENFDLRKYDLILSEGTAWPKGVLTKPHQLHISYIHTPPRFLYKYSVESSKRNKWYFKWAIAIIDHYLRLWDFVAAQRPDFLLANSNEIQKRIKKFYKRDAKVIYPPVEVNFKLSAEHNDPDNIKQPYYLAAGRLVAYKNFDLLVSAFNLLGLPLYIVGTGLEEKRLRKMAKSNIIFMGRAPDQVKHRLMKNALGLINPIADEDFGIVPIEALSHGTPVLAHKSGGHLEFIKEGFNGMFFEQLTVEHLVQQIKAFDTNVHAKKYDRDAIRQDVQKFSKERFKQEVKDFVDQKWEEHARTTGSIYNNDRPE
ncbi:MAG: hypothetical protein ACD_22C00191G0005 [uncultured bacterium]|nr:MAG: hypothetical protein ACD_22C00191G0005 [uncultured bacterium]